jgi:hypothetical protein
MHAPVEVTAYRCIEIGSADHSRAGESLADSAREIYAEDFGDLDGDIPGWDEATERAVARAITIAIEHVFDELKVKAWRCESIATRTFDAAECETILREYCPEWFDEPDAEIAK